MYVFSQVIHGITLKGGCLSKRSSGLNPFFFFLLLWVKDFKGLRDFCEELFCQSQVVFQYVILILRTCGVGTLSDMCSVCMGSQCLGHGSSWQVMITSGYSSWVSTYSFSATLLPAGGVSRTQKLRFPPPTNRPPPLMGSQGYQRFPLYKPGVGQNMAVHATPADRTSTYLHSFYLPNSSFNWTSFFSQQWNVS